MFNEFCYVDLDGVLTDFHNAVMQWYNIPKETKFELGSWHTVEKMCHVLKINETDFWCGLSSRFWSQMPWTAFGHRLLETVEKEFGFENICLLSSAANAESAHGKIRWLKYHLPKYLSKGHVYIGRNKKFAASCTSILIDDGDHNIEAFEACHGVGILVPQFSNSKHYLADKSLEYVLSEIPKSRSIIESRKNNFKNK